MADRRSPHDEGAAVVEYVFVAVLLVAVFLAVAQVALLVHTRNVLTADAAEGARSAALRGSGLDAGERDCVGLVRQSLSSLDANCSADYEGSDVRLVRMRVQAAVPLSLVPFGHVHLDVSARAVVEP